MLCTAAQSPSVYSPHGHEAAPSAGGRNACDAATMRSQGSRQAGMHWVTGHAQDVVRLALQKIFGAPDSALRDVSTDDSHWPSLGLGVPDLRRKQNSEVEHRRFRKHKEASDEGDVPERNQTVAKYWLRLAREKRHSRVHRSLCTATRGLSSGATCSACKRAPPWPSRQKQIDQQQHFATIQLYRAHVHRTPVNAGIERLRNAVPL